jgi:hypothetical protein
LKTENEEKRENRKEGEGRYEESEESSIELPSNLSLFTFADIFGFLVFCFLSLYKKTIIIF